MSAGQGDSSLMIYHTQSAIARSINPSTAPMQHSALIHTVGSNAHSGYEPSRISERLPRGHLTFYRMIQPPSKCMAYKIRLDPGGVDGQAGVVLVFAAREAIYIWGLVDENERQVIPIEPGDRCDVEVCSSIHIKPVCAKQGSNSPSISTRITYSYALSHNSTSTPVTSNPQRSCRFHPMLTNL
jgi:hypothetical protein